MHSERPAEAGRYVRAHLRAVPGAAYLLAILVVVFAICESGSEDREDDDKNREQVRCARHGAQVRAYVASGFSRTFTMHDASPASGCWPRSTHVVPARRQ